MGVARSTIGKLLYGVLFVVALPAVLVSWAAATQNRVSLPVLPYAWAGPLIAGIGVALLVSAWIALMAFGHGLPMNPYPPSHYVMRGIYRYLAHPIYVGFILVCIGVAMHFSSSSGLWLVTPMVALGTAAGVLGYERHDLRARFGDAVRNPLIALPPDEVSSPTKWDRVSIFLLVFLPWSVAYELVYHLGVPPDAIVAHLSFERSWPVLEWTEAIYGSVYLFVISAPLLVRARRALRRFAVTGLIATAVVTLIYLTVPVIAPPRAFEPQGFLGRMLLVERSMSHTVAAFPAFHVIWSLIAADAWATRSRTLGAFGWVWAALIAVSCITTGMHAILDLVAAIVVFVALRNIRSIWHATRNGAELIANSWHEWRWHGVRVLNYALYAALAATVGFWISTTLGGRQVFWQLVFIHLCGLLGAGMWAQKLEGSIKLSRPFGYYGGAIGGGVGCLIAGAFGGNILLLMTLIAVEGPWLQAIGRLRCLVQGCCHGHEAPEGIGIRYWQPRSRVCVLGDLEGVPLHPTPLYSILANVVIGVLLLRLWVLAAPLGIIAGGYLMLSGAARFVEESYRGEPQTPKVAGLPIYQWMATLSFASGVALTMLPGGGVHGMRFGFDTRVAIAGVIYGLIVGCAMGVDFPGSTRRFARLASP